MFSKTKSAMCIIVLLLGSVILNGCAPLWFAGGAAAGVGIAKDAEDGKIIDD